VTGCRSYSHFELINYEEFNTSSGGVEFVVNFPLAASIAFNFRAASCAASVAEPLLGVGVSHLLARFRLQQKNDIKMNNF
jgi:hypothetical protein